MMENKKIGIIIRSLELGGAEKQSVLLAKNLKQKYQVHFFVQHSNLMNERLLELLRDQNIVLHKLEGGLIKRLFQFISINKKERIGILFTYLMIDNILGSCLKLFFPKLKVYGGVRNCFLPTSKFIINKLTHKLFHTQTIFNNYSGRDYYITKGFKLDKTLVIPNCMESISSPIERKIKSSVKILTVGRFVPQKDYYTALETIKNLIDRGLNINYRIIGYGDLEEAIRQWIKELDLEEIVTITIKPKNIYDFYKESDIYLCSSLFEGVSNTIMEAMNFSLPIVATDVGDNTTLVKDKINGYIVPSSDSNLLADNLDKLINSNELRNKFGMESNKLLRTNFSKDAFLRKYEAVIENN